VLFEAHIETSKDLLLSDSRELMAEIEEMLREKFQITHTTLQVEFDVCADKAMIKQPRSKISLITRGDS
jgi:cobalt-zinc-cadmium efflux system protein